MDSEDEFLDRLYEAAALPELWPDVLGRLNGVAGLADSLILGIQGADVRWTASRDFVPTAEEYLRRGYIGRDDRTHRLLRAEHEGFLRDLDVFTPEEWAADPIRRELFVPAGYGWGIATNIFANTGDVMIVHGERRFNDGPPPDETVQLMDRLRPHIARAVLLSQRLAFRTAQTTADALQVLGIPAAVLDGRGRVMGANALMVEHEPSLVQLGGARFALVRPAADDKLMGALGSFGQQLQVAQVQSIPVPAGPTHPAVVAHLYPVRRAVRDLFNGAVAIVLIAPVNRQVSPDPALLQGLFDLTPAEARLARGLGQGATLDEHAARMGVSMATVRSQLKAIFAKTGVSRQADLVGLMRGLAVDDLAPGDPG